MAREIEDGEDSVPVGPSGQCVLSRRRLLVLGVAGSGLLLLPSCGQNEPEPVSPPALPPVEMLTAETRREMTLYTKDVHDVLNSVLNPALGRRFDHSYVTEARDKELMEWWQSRLIRKNEDRIDLRMRVRRNKDETKYLPVYLTMVLGQRWGNIFPHQVHLRTNLIEAGQFYPQLNEFIDETGKGIPVDRLKDMGRAFFAFPADMAWDNFYDAPSLQNINGIHGKSSSNDSSTPLTDIRIGTNGIAELFYYPPFYTPLNFPLSK